VPVALSHTRHPVLFHLALSWLCTQTLSAPILGDLLQRGPVDQQRDRWWRHVAVLASLQPARARTVPLHPIPLPAPSTTDAPRAACTLLSALGWHEQRRWLLAVAANPSHRYACARAFVTLGTADDLPLLRDFAQQARGTSIPSLCLRPRVALSLLALGADPDAELLAWLAKVPADEHDSLFLLEELAQRCGSPRVVWPVVEQVLVHKRHHAASRVASQPECVGVLRMIDEVAAAWRPVRSA